MLNNTLNTNEIKNAAGTEVEFSRLSTSERSTEYAQIGESPALPFRLSIKYTESGVGLKRRRRSVVRFDKTVVSTVDSVTPATDSAYVVADISVGARTTNAVILDVIAALNSFLSTTGAATTVLFDGSGNGSKVLVEGSL